MDWTTPLSKILPEFRPMDPVMSDQLLISDFLSHRSGLSGDMSLALQEDLEFLLPRSELARTVNDLNAQGPFRLQWAYNNWGYSIAGSVIEQLSEKPFHNALKHTALDQLNLSSTTSQPTTHETQNFAEAYVSLSNASFHHLPRQYPFENSIFESAGGMYSNVHDLLNYAKAVLEAEQNPFQSPLKGTQLLLSNQIPLDNPSRHNRFYGMGWIRTQFPGVVGLQGDNANLFAPEELPVIGLGSSATMTYYHQGAGLGYYSAIFLLPETQSAVVVLANSFPLNDAADWIAQVYMSTLLDSSKVADYVELAKESRRRKLANVEKMHSSIAEIKQNNPGPPPRPLKTLGAILQ